MSESASRESAGASPVLRRISGIVLFLGTGLIGLPFLLLGASVGHFVPNSTYEAMWTMWGLGIMLIGLSFAIARM